MSTRRLLLLMLLFVVQVFPAVAWTYRTPEGVTLGNLKVSIEFFESEKGRLPESWKELETQWNRPLDDVFPHVLPTRRYAFYSSPLNLKLHEKRSLHVVAITRKPMWETTRKGSMGRTTALKGPGRYVLHREEDGELFYQWFDESEIQRLWPSTGQALPVPDQEPERSWVQAARRKIMMKRVGIGAAVVLIAAWIVARILGKRRDRTMQPVG